MQDPCLETYDSDLDPVFASPGIGPNSAQLSQSLLQQAATAAPGRGQSHPRHQARAATALENERQRTHSPDSSATLTGSGLCSDASDLTSSHPSDLPRHHHKRIKLSSTQPAQLAVVQHASAQCAPDPNLDPLSTAAEVGMQLPKQHGLGPSAPVSQAPDGNALFPPSFPLSASAPRRRDKVLQEQAPEDSKAPPYVPCLVAGLTQAQQHVKAEEEQQLAEALRRQQNMFKAGYEMDDFGGVCLPHSKYTRTLSMKVVFAQRWQHEAQAARAPADAAQLSMKQLLLDEAVQLENEQALVGEVVPSATQVPGQCAIPAAHAKLPMRFKLSEAKNAMRKAELGGPEMSSTSSGNQTPTGSDNRHTAWQVGQLQHTPLLNNAWVEYYIDRFNTDFDSSYWSMLEHLSAGT